jgi:hypothetical protein
MKTREEIAKAAKKLEGTFIGIGFGAAASRLERQMAALQIELLLDIREAILNLPTEKE